MSKKEHPAYQELILDLLAARYRLGERVWTLDLSPVVLRGLNALEDKGLVNWKAGVVQDTLLAWLTDAGIADRIDPAYEPPITEQLREVESLLFCSVQTAFEKVSDELVWSALTKVRTLIPPRKE